MKYCELNLYKVNLTLTKAYKKRIFIKETETYSSLQEKAYKLNGILIKNKEEIISYKDDNADEVVNFEELTEHIQSQLLQLYLKKEKKLFYILSKFIPNLERPKYIIQRDIEGNIFKINNEFFTSLNIKQSIIPKLTLLEEMKYKSVSEIIGREVRPIGKKSVAIVKNILFQNTGEYEEEIEKMKEYFIKNKKEFKIKNEPLIQIEFKKGNGTIYPYFASELKFYYTPKDIEEKLVIANQDRKKLIENAIIKSEIKYLSLNPYKTYFYEFHPVTFKGFKEVKFLSYLLIKDKNRNLNILHPKRIPPIFQKENIINTLIFADKNINFSNNHYIKTLFSSLKEIKTTTNIIFKLLNSKDFFIEEFTSQNIVNKALKYKKNTVIPPLVITIGSRYNSDYYEDMKRKLFKYGFITQNIIYENLSVAKIYEINNLTLQILVKYGLYPYTIEINHPYDYILGIDVGNDNFGNRRIAGGISVINKNGVLEKLIPIKFNTNGEKVNLSSFLEEVSIYLPLKNKNILILRDGQLRESEKVSILKEFKNLSLKSVTFMNIIKKHSLRVYEDNIGRKGIILKDNLALLLSHQIKAANPVKIGTKSVIENGRFREEKINKNDLNLLFKLTNLNYSNLYLYSQRLRLPAPIHYADKFVKALGKNWEIKEELLLNGFLYFI